MARLTWVLAVAELTNSCPAISSLDGPPPTSAITSRARGGELFQLPGRICALTRGGYRDPE
jgi:hypothetical protein